MIADGRAIFGAGLNEGLHGERLAHAARTRGRVVPALSSVAEDAPPLAARVQTANLGDGPLTHWVVVCECGTASAVWLDTPLTFCVRCWNQAYRKRWRPVVFPDADTIAEIDRLLSLRPERNRWWTPDETLSELMIDNAAHGFGV